MRTSGIATDTQRLGEHDHCCWVYEGRDDFHSRVVEFLQDGLKLGLRSVYVDHGHPDVLLRRLEGIDRSEGFVATGALALMSIDDLYDIDAGTDPGQQVAKYAAATEVALKEGFAGLRVAVEATDLVQRHADVESFIRYEHLIDRYMVDHPFSAMCAYDRNRLGQATLDRIACLHPVTDEGSTQFRLFMRDSESFGLDGEIDYSSWDLFEQTVELAEPPDSGVMSFDISGLDFIDHHSLYALSRHAQRHNSEIVLMPEKPIVARLVDLLDIPHLRLGSAA